MRLIILGAGGYGRTVADVASQMDRYDQILFLDDNSNNENVIGLCADYLKYIDEHTEFYPAFGNNSSRMNWIRKLKAAGAALAVICHSSAYVSPTATLDEGAAVMPKAAINTGCHVLSGSIVNLGALVDHDCVIGEGAHICVGAIIKAENRIPDGMKVEAGEAIMRGQYSLS